MDDAEDFSEFLDYYVNCLRDSDQHIGTVLQALDQQGLAQDTVVLFTADHGEMGGEHSLRQKGNMLYKENFGVPFLMRLPPRLLQEKKDSR